MIKLLLDQGLPRSTVSLLQSQGWDVEHVGDIGMSRAADNRIIDYARKTERVCVTLDSDFHTLLAVSNVSGPSVIRIRQEGLKGNDIAQLLINIHGKIENQLQQGVMVTVTEEMLRLRQLPVVK